MREEKIERVEERKGKREREKKDCCKPKNKIALRKKANYYYFSINIWRTPLALESEYKLHTAYPVAQQTESNRSRVNGTTAKPECIEMSKINI